MNYETVETLTKLTESANELIDQAQRTESINWDFFKAAVSTLKAIDLICKSCKVEMPYEAIEVRKYLDEFYGCNVLIADIK